MQLRFLLLSILIGTQLSLSLAFAQKVTVYKGATLVDASREKTIENAVLVISEGRIQAVGPAKEIPIPAFLANAYSPAVVTFTIAPIINTSICCRSTLSNS